MDQLIEFALTSGFTSPVIIIFLGIACVYLYKKYEQFTELTQKSQEQNLESIDSIKRTLDSISDSNSDIEDSLNNLQLRLNQLENRMSTIDGRSSSEMTSILRDIDAIKRVLELCMINKQRLK